jgi:hypothetical protein
MAEQQDQPAAVSFLQRFAGIVADATEWMAGLLGDDTTRRAVLSDLGLDPLDGQTVDEQQLLQQLAPDLTAVRTYATANVDQADVVALAATVEAITNMVDAMTSVIETVSSPSDGRGAVEVVTSLLQLFVIDLMRETSPAFYAFARSAQVIADEALTVDWDAVGKFFEDFFAAFRLKTEHDAVLATPWLMAVVTAIAALVTKAVTDFGGTSTEQDEAETFDVVYGWDPDPTLPPELQPAERIAQRTITMLFGDRLGGHGSVSMAVLPAEHRGPGLLVGLGGQAVIGTIDEDDAGPNPGVRLTIGAGSAVSAYLPLPGSLASLQLFGPDALKLAVEVAGARKRRILGPSGATRIEAGQVLIDFNVLADRAVLRWGVKDAALVLDLSKSDNFLKDLVGAKELRVPFNLVLGVDTANGFFVEGGTGLAATVPVNKSLAGIRIDTVSLSLQFPDSGAFRLDVAAVVGLDLGMFQATVDQIGFALDIDFAGGNLAIADVDTRFRPPKGIGLTLAFEELRGGGYLYLDPDKGEYAGVLQLEFSRSGLKALGILTTKGLPNDQWALLLIVYATVTPPVGAMGWVLTGVGGIIGVNHSVSEDAFRAGLRTKALDDVLFPKDPVANAGRILATLRTLFPVTGDKALIGIAAEFQYLSTRRVSIRLGLILQIGSSGIDRVVILGQLKVSAPGEKNGILTLNADLFGLIEWGEHQVRIAVDTVLYDSKIGIGDTKFTITGSLSVRVTIGRDAMVLFTAGGFHPDFEVPANLKLPAKLDRFGFKLDKGIARMTLAGYAALTPCTMQFGVQVDLVAKKFGFSVEVSMGLHVLLDQDKGRFTTDIEVVAALKRGSTTLMKVELRLTLSGPGRWRAAGSAKFKLWFFSKTISFDESWGDLLGLALPLIDALAGLVAELSDVANWGGVPIGRSLVALRARNGTTESLLHPLSALSVDQRLLPLGVQLDRIGGNRISGPNRLDIKAVRVGLQRFETPDAVRNQFARGQFVDMSDEVALALPSFEPMKSGVVVGPAAAHGGTPREQAIEYETIYPVPEDKPPMKPPPHRFDFDQVVLAAQLGAVSRASPSVTGGPLFEAELPAIKVGVRNRTYLIADGDTMLAADGAIRMPLHEALEQLALARAAGDLRAVLVNSHEVAT